MKISGILLESLAQKPEIPMVGGKTADQNFEDMLKSSSSTPIKPNRYQQRTGPVQTVKTASEPMKPLNQTETEPSQNNVTTETADNTPVSDDTPVVQKPQTEEGNLAEDNEAQVDSKTQEIVAALAAILGMTVQEIETVLKELDIKPEMLIEPENMSKFLVAVNDVESAEQLINLPEVQTQMAAIKQIIEPVAQKETEKAITPKTETALETAENISTIASPTIPVSQTEQGSQSSNDDKTSQREATTSENSAVTTKAQAPQTQEIGVDNFEVEITPQSYVTVRYETQNPVVGVRNESVRFNAQDIIQQVASKIKVDVRMDTTEIKMTLKPESLGEVSLKIMTHNGIVTAQFLAESQRVKEILESSFNQLRDSLTEAGLRVSELTVQVGSEQEQSRMAQFRQQREKSAARIARILGRDLESEPETQAKPVSDSEIDITI